MRAAILWTERRLAGARLHYGHGTDNPRDEAAWLVAGASRLPPTKLHAHLADRLAPAARARLQSLVTRRIKTRKPTAYLLNEAWFAGLRFYVDERVIVPRSLTGEFIAERFAPWISPARVRRILDLGTGSGCMAIACARAFPAAQIDAVDISAAALAVARINVARHRLARRVRLAQSDLFQNLRGKRYDVIVTNPPYVGRAEMKTLPREHRHEPVPALASGRSGLDAISAILRDTAEHLKPGGILVAEVGNSKSTLMKNFPALPFVWLTTRSGDDTVFVLTAEQLAKQRAPNRRVAAGTTTELRHKRARR